MSAEPRFQTVLGDEGDSWAWEIEKAAETLGTPLMKWQQKAARLIGARKKNGLPKFKTIIVSVPRQQGKTVLSRAAITARALQDSGLEIYGTAQSRQYAAKHVVKLGEALADTQDVKVLRGIGAESVTWPTGTSYRPLSPTEGGGHGDSIDFMLVDEGWTLQAIVMGGIRPAMIARPHSQLLLISTMGTVSSDVWNGLVQKGRESVEDPNSAIGFLEYSAPTDESVWDEDRWHEWMPALGHTVSVDDVRVAIEDLEAVSRNEVVRAFGNRTVTALVSVFPDEWIEKAWGVLEPPEKFVLAVDVNDDPAGASIATAHQVGENAIGVRLVEWASGSPKWVPGRVKDMLEKRTVEAVAADFGGPARVLKHELEAVCERANVALLERTPRDIGADTAGFYDALKENQVALVRTEALQDALNGAQRKTIGDLWVITRRSMTTDASPLISTILAHGLAKETALKPTIKPFVL